MRLQMVHELQDGLVDFEFTEDCAKGWLPSWQARVWTGEERASTELNSHHLFICPAFEE